MFGYGSHFVIFLFVIVRLYVKLPINFFSLSLDVFKVNKFAGLMKCNHNSNLNIYIIYFFVMVVISIRLNKYFFFSFQVSQSW